MKNFDGLQLGRVLHDEREAVLGQRPADLDVGQVWEKFCRLAQFPG